MKQREWERTAVEPSSQLSGLSWSKCTLSQRMNLLCTLSQRRNLLMHAKAVLGKFFLVFKLSTSGYSIEVIHPETGKLPRRERQKMAPQLLLPRDSHTHYLRR